MALAWEVSIRRWAISEESVEETCKVLSPSSESAQDLALKATVAHPQIPTMLTPIKPKASGLSETRTRAAEDSAAKAIITIKT